MEPMRLQKFLARAGVASRRASERLIEQGQVSVNGEVVLDQGHKVVPGVDTVSVNGARVELVADDVTFMLNKPTGVISSMKDPYNRPTVADYLPLNEHPSLFPVGRLDEDTTGLLLFTTDGLLGNELLHPKNHVEKTYRVTVEGTLTPTHCARLVEGVELEDGKTASARVENIEIMRTTTMFDLTIHEGKKREVRRMCEALRLPVIALHRHTFAGIELGALALGAVRELTPEEGEILKKALRNNR